MRVRIENSDSLIYFSTDTKLPAWYHFHQGEIFEAWTAWGKHVGDYMVASGPHKGCYTRRQHAVRV